MGKLHILKHTIRRDSILLFDVGLFLDMLIYESNNFYRHMLPWPGSSKGGKDFGRKNEGAVPTSFDIFGRGKGN